MNLNTDVYICPPLTPFMLTCNHPQGSQALKLLQRFNRVRHLLSIYFINHSSISLGCRHLWKLNVCKSQIFPTPFSHGQKTVSKKALFICLAFHFHFSPNTVHPGCRSGDPSEAKSRDKHLIKV